MKQPTDTYLESETTEELFYIFKHDGAMDFKKKLAAGRILHQKNYNTKQLRRERDLIVNSLKKEIAEFEDKSGFKNKMSIQNRKSTFFNVLSSLTSIAIYIYLYFQQENKDKYFIAAGIILLIIVIMYNLITYKQKFKKLISIAKEDNKTQKQKLDLIAREWTF